MPRYVVARADELGPGERLITTIGGRSVGVFNVDGEFYAIRNRCPHQGAELCRGRTVGPPARSPEPGRFIHEGGVPWLQCPWHGWEFDLATGQSWFDPAAVRVRAYAVSVEHRQLLEADPEARGPVKGPFTAETYAVEVEADYVVIDTDRRASGH